MIQKIKKFILNNKQDCIIGVILLASFVLMAWYSFGDKSIWWDEAVYMGMGKYIASWGSVGFWEIFRPPFLPLIYSFLYTLNIPLIFAGKIIIIFSSVGLMYLIYLFGESIRKNSGIFSCLILLITPIFFYHSKIPTTDIISVFFGMLSFWFFSKKKYFLTGIFIAFSFLLRFPQGLMLLPIGIIIIYETHNRNFKLWLGELFRKGFLVVFGFMIIVIPYLISNYLMYGNILEPMILGNKVVNWSSSSYNFGTWYYAKELLTTAPLLYLSLLAPIFFYKKNFFINPESKKRFINIFIIVIIFIIYFFLQPHKELRYSLSFVPYLAILSGITLSFIFKSFKQKKLIFILLIIFIIFFSLKIIPYFKDKSGDAYVPLNNYLERLDGLYISTTPVPAAIGKVKVSVLFESASGFHNAFNGNSDTLDGVIIKDCDIFCPEKTKDKLCVNDLDLIYKEIDSSSFKKQYEVSITGCKFSIFNKIK